MLSFLALIALVALLIYHTFSSHTRKDLWTGIAALGLLIVFLCLA